MDEFRTRDFCTIHRYLKDCAEYLRDCYSEDICIVLQKQDGVVMLRMSVAEDENGRKVIWEQPLTRERRS